MGVSENEGYLPFGGPDNKDPTIWGTKIRGTFFPTIWGTKIRGIFFGGP